MYVIIVHVIILRVLLFEKLIIEIKYFIIINILLNNYIYMTMYMIT